LLHLQRSQAAEGRLEEEEVREVKEPASTPTPPHPVLQSRSRSNATAPLPTRQPLRALLAARNTMTRTVPNHGIVDHQEPDAVVPQSHVLSTLKVKSELDVDIGMRHDPLKFRDLWRLQCKLPKFMKK